MSTRHPNGVARKACRRCSAQKKRCDKALPACTLCARLHQRCKYGNLPSSSPTLSPSTRPEFSLSLGASTKVQVETAIIQKLGSFDLESAILRYSRAIDPHFPVISISRLQSRLPQTWDDTPLDLSLVYLSIVLLTTAPPFSPEDDSNPSEFKSLYFCIKSWISLIEGSGVNTLESLQARVLVTLFEVTHGFYPAAHISIGSVVRAADALAAYPAADKPLSNYPNGKTEQEEGILTWCGITALDRYIAIESSSYAPLTRSYAHSTWTPIETQIYPLHTVGQDGTAPISPFSRVFESYSFLDKFLTIQNNPTPEQLLNIEHLLDVEEIIRLVKAVNSLKTTLHGEILKGREIYSNALAICDIGLLFAFKDGCKVTPVDEATSRCLSIGVKFRNFLLSSIVSMVEPFTLGAQPLDVDLLPPSAMFLVYKTAAIVTEKLQVDSEFDEGVRRLRILRQFLEVAGKRWLCCKRYLQLLDEDTTPRVLRAVEEG